MQDEDRPFVAPEMPHNRNEVSATTIHSTGVLPRMSLRTVLAARGIRAFPPLPLPTEDEDEDGINM